MHVRKADADNTVPSAPGADLTDYNYNPPTYDEAVKIMAGQQGGGGGSTTGEGASIPTDDPPPYQP